MQMLTIAFTIFQAVGQIQQGAAQKAAANADAKFSLVQGNASAALSKADAANQQLDRVRKLRMAIGKNLVNAAGAGVSATSGSVGDLIESNSGQYARDVGIIDFNSRQAALAAKAGSQNDAAMLKFRGQQAYQAGVWGAVGTIGNFAASTYNRGSISTYQDGRVDNVGSPINWNA